MNPVRTEFSHKDHYIVAIGASAGGLEAIHEFFDNMPSNGNLSFIIVQHLSPDYKSLLVELVGKHTHMQVLEADHEMEVEMNSVYVIPNNKLLTIRNNRLLLAPKVTEKVPNTAIDTFLHSLAEDKGSKAIAIILSGTGTDGSRGIAEIHRKGGLVLVQEPVSAKFDGMPNSAIATGVVDHILAPEMMPEEIYNYINEKPDPLNVAGQPDESALPEVLKLIEMHCQQDFTNYKTPTILRRITRRMGLLGYQDFQDYLQLLRNSPEECVFLSREFLIGVTRFFRDKPAFQALRDHVVDPLITEKENGDLLKVWITACSTGEEAYSVAMVIDSILEEKNKQLDVKIFASDIDSQAIEFASKGTYRAEDLKDIDPDIIEKYFTEESGRYIVIPPIRKQIVFARHNILKDPPFIKNDLVTCRNMLIYMNSQLQRKVLSTLQFSLNNQGYLFLGPSESPLNIQDGFSEINGKWKIFRKQKGDYVYNPERLPSAQIYKTDRQLVYSNYARESVVQQELNDEFKQALTEKFGYAALYIDRNFDIKEALGQFKKYLSLPDKIGSLNLLKMVDKDLSVSLNAAVRKCMKENREVVLTKVKTRASGEKAINIYIRPSQKHQYTLLILDENPGSVSNHPSIVSSVVAEPGSERYIQELEDELKETRLNLQVTVESLETANEELQSSNEELLSANEELQSSNEELQSLNEELHTLNTEHQLRIRELIELNDDLNNYFRSSEIAQVFVDGNFRIRKFNPVAVKMINLIESDIGRPIAHISNNIKDGQDFIDDIRHVVDTGVMIEKEIRLNNGATNLMKIFPFVRQDKVIDGAIITFIDISHVTELNSIIRGVFNATISAVMAFRAVRNDKSRLSDLEFIAANHASDTLIGKANSAYIGKLLSAEFPSLATRPFMEKYVTVIHTGEEVHSEIRLGPANDQIWYDMIVTPLMDGVVISLTDINEKKKAEETLKNNYQELIRAKENYRNLNLQLEQKIGERTLELSKSEERFRLITGVISDAVWDRDLITDSIWISDSFYNWFGYENTEGMRAVKFWDMHIHPDDIKKVKERIAATIHSAENEWTIDYRLRKSDGEYIAVTEKGMVLKDEHGIPFRLLGAITDRTAEEIARQNQELKAFNAELEKVVAQRTADLEAEKNKMHSLFMQAPAMICTLKGPDHVFDLVNPLYQQLFGNRKLKGRSVHAALPELANDRIMEILDEVYKSGEPYVGKEVGLKMARNEGAPLEEIFFNFVYQPTLDEQNQVEGILVFAYEVTDQVYARQAIQEANEVLRKANEEFRFVTDFMPQMVWVTRADGNHIFYNKGWYEYTGLTYEDSQGEGWNLVLHPEDQQKAWKVWSHSLQTGDPYEIEYRFKRFDGEYRWFLGRALPLRNQHGEIMKWFGTCTDIHDQKMMNDILEQKVYERTHELQKTNAELENTNNELMQFASVASHDLKEPLRKITIFSHLVKDRYHREMSKGALDYLDKIIASSTRMGYLVNDLLSFTKLSGSENNFVKTDLNEVLAEVLSDLELVIREKNAEIRSDRLPEAEVQASQMRQIFQNIISNSLKFCKSDTPPEIRIRSERVNALQFDAEEDENGEYFRITIRDNGIGFSNEYAEKIFTIFQRLHARSDYQGTGIGLAIAKKIINKHNGIIKASGIENEGASFIMVLPLKYKSER